MSLARPNRRTDPVYSLDVEGNCRVKLKSSDNQNNPILYLENSSNLVEMYFDSVGKFGEAFGAKLIPTYGGELFVIEAQVPNESAGLAFSGDSATIWNPADDQLLWFQDEDSMDNDASNSSYLSYIDGSSGSLVTSSDLRFKTDVITLSSAGILEEIQRIRPVKYRRKCKKQKNANKNKFKRTEIGFIAQEVEQTGLKGIVHQPKATSDNPDPYRSIDYSRMVVYLTMAVQELTNQVKQFRLQSEQYPL